MTGLLEKHFHAENRDGKPWERPHKKLAWLGWFVVLSLVVCSCSPSRMVTNMAANAIAEGSGRSFASDDDPELVAEAMPFALKLQESLLEKSPKNEKLLIATGKGFVAYAHLFVREPADRLPKDDYQKIERLRKRAKRLYLRGVAYLVRGLEGSYPDFGQALTKGRVEDVLKQTRKKDVAALYWISAGLMGAISADPMDMELTMKREPAIRIMRRALELDEFFSDGAIHEFFISLYGSLPASMGGSEKKARDHFKRAIEISHGEKANPYVALASTVCVKKQDYEEFKSLLEKALAIDVKRFPENRLANVIAQRKARWLLAHAGEFFLIDEEKSP